MSEFNEYNWKAALISVFEKSIQDADYRNLCLADPVAAIAQVSDIELPPEAKTNLRFFGSRADFIYAFLLPPVPDPQAQSGEQVREMIQWSTICTDFTTTLTGA